MTDENLMYLLIGNVVGGLLFGLFSSSKNGDDEKRLARLEQKLDFLLDKFGVERDPSGDKGRGLILPVEHQAMKAYQGQNHLLRMRKARYAIEAIKTQFKALRLR